MILTNIYDNILSTVSVDRYTIKYFKGKHSYFTEFQVIVK